MFTLILLTFSILAAFAAAKLLAAWTKGFSFRETRKTSAQRQARTVCSCCNVRVGEPSLRIE